MGYMHIDNLYKNQEILNFKECYALEKIHGTSAHIAFKRIPTDIVGEQNSYPDNGQFLTVEEYKQKYPDKIEITFFSGGASHEQFVGLFDKKALEEKFLALNCLFAIVYGEAYGGKQQGMSKTYGPVLKFVAFDYFAGKSKEDAWWYSVPAAEHFVKELGLEFVVYERIPATVEALDAERDKPSRQAIRNGMGDTHIAEGIVARPLFEYRKSKEGGRVISKHKRDEFKETATKREVVQDPNYLKVLEDANMIAEEWVVEQRLSHIMDKISDKDDLGIIIRAMIEDVEREGAGEIVIGKETRGAISKRTVKLYKELKTKQMNEK